MRFIAKETIPKEITKGFTYHGSASIVRNDGGANVVRIAVFNDDGFWSSYHSDIFIPKDINISDEARP